MKKRSRLIAELTENCWAVDPEHYKFLLNFLMGEVAPNKELAAEMRGKNKEVQAENSNNIGDTGIAYIPLMGMIYPRATMMTEYSGGVTLTELTKQFTEARDNPEIKGIIFDVDGPGGAATGVNEFANTLYNSRGSKPIYAYVGGTAASATYWITSAVDKVFADATARVGSVGTVVGVPKKGADDYYVEITNTLSPYKRPNVEDESHYKNIVKYLDDMTDVFYDSLSRNFGLPKDHVIKNFGEGGMKVGNTALQSKMIHEISSFSGTVESMLEVITHPGYESATPSSSLFFDMGGRVDSFSVTGVNAKMSEVIGGIMDIKELREKYPNLVSEIEEAASATASKNGEEKLNSVLDLVQKKDIEVGNLVSENETLKKSISELEKSNLQSKAEASKSQAEVIFAEKMGNSTIPEPFHKKINKQIGFSSFLNEDGSLDKEKYSEAVDAEVADWEATFSSSQEIHGVVTKPGDEQEENKEDNEIDETAARLIAYAK